MNSCRLHWSAFSLLLPATDPAHKQRVIDRELDYGVQLLRALLKQIVQLQRRTGTFHGTAVSGLLASEMAHWSRNAHCVYHFGLFHRARKTIQQKPFFAGGTVQILLDELDDHLITHLTTQDRQRLSQNKQKLKEVHKKGFWGEKKKSVENHQDDGGHLFTLPICQHPWSLLIFCLIPSRRPPSLSACPQWPDDTHRTSRLVSGPVKAKIIILC